MTSTLTLKNKHLRCVLRPDLGGSIESLVWQGLNGLVSSDVPIFREPPQQIRTVHDMGSFVLVPFAFDARHSLTLEGGALSMSLSITNQAPQPAQP